VTDDGSKVTVTVERSAEPGRLSVRLESDRLGVYLHVFPHELEIVDGDAGGEVLLRRGGGTPPSRRKSSKKPGRRKARRAVRRP
jgi:hypothetical protein